MNMLVPIVLVGLAVGGLALWFGLRLEDRRVVRESLSRVDGYDLSPTAAPVLGRESDMAESIGSRAVLPALQKLTGLVKRATPGGYADKVRLKHVYAGIQSPDAVDRFLATKSVLLPVGIVGALYVLFVGLPGVDGMLGLVAAGLVGIGIPYYPDISLNNKVTSRQKSILRNLPDVLDLLTISVEAGLGFEQALDRVINAVPCALSDEFARFLGEARSGSSRADALRAMDERIGVPELRSFVLAIIQADTFGVSIGRVLRAQSDEMRIKRRQIAQEKAQKAPVKMLIPMVFCIFPALFAVVLGPAAINIMETMGS